MIIDAHTHTFPKKIASSVVDKLEKRAKSRAYTDATEEELIKSMKKSNINASIILPIATNIKQTQKLNDIAIEKNKNFSKTGIFSLGTIHPDYEDYKSELKRIKKGGLTGIKIHPAYQGVDLDDIRFLRIIEFAEELDLAVVIHAGLDIGFPEHNYADINQISLVIEKIKPKKMVLAHLGGWKDWDNVEKYLVGSDVYMDTAFSLGRYEPPKDIFVEFEKTKMISNEQFKRIVEKHGYDKIIFGTDSPWGAQEKVLDNIYECKLNEKEIHKVLADNAVKVYNLPQINLHKEEI